MTGPRGRIIFEFNGDDFKNETGRDLSDTALIMNAVRLNEELSLYCGYEGWRVEVDSPGGMAE